MSESQEPGGEAPRTPIIEHVPDSEPVPASQHATSAAGGIPPVPPYTAPAPAQATAPRGRGGTPIPLTLLLCAALAGGIYWSWTHPQSPPQPDPQAAIDAAKSKVLEKLQGLSGRIDALEKQGAPAADLAKRLDELSARQDQDSSALQKLQDIVAQKPAAPEAAPPAPPPATPPSPGVDTQQLADLSSKLDQALSQEKASLDALDQRLGKLEQGSAVATQAQDNKQSIDTLAGRVQTLEKTEGQIASVKQDATLAVKLSAAQVALSSGEPLGDLPGAPPALARFATTAPPTMASLRADFPAVAQAVLAASRPEETQSSLLDRALARLEQTVTVRRGDHVIVGDPAAGVVAKAQQALNDDNLQGATDTLAALTGRARQAAAPWIEQARSLLAARAALAQLAAHG